MLDIRIIREHPEVVKKNLKKRGLSEQTAWVDKLLAEDKKWRADLKAIEQLRHKRNILTQAIAQAKREGKNVSRQIQEVRNIPITIKTLEQKNEKRKEKIRFFLMRLPNLLHDSVPVGQDERNNKVVKKVGKPPRFLFHPKNHLEILENLGMIDGERAAKISGAGFFYLKGAVVLLDYALMRYTMDFLAKRKFQLIEPPFMLRRNPYEGVTDVDDFENVMYRIHDEDLYLVATSEHSLAAMFQNEVLDAEQLPIRLAGVSPCFRKEIGAHGKYTKGLFRMHQFNKVEQFIFSLPEDSWTLHEELQINAEQLYKNLGLTFRVVNVCTGDIGSLAAKKYDIDVWMADGVYREAGSNSNCTDFQARRLNIRYREKKGEPVKGIVHTLNNTAIATSRTMVAILEQFQQRDGSVKIPRVIVPYMDGVTKLEKPSA